MAISVTFGNSHVSITSSLELQTTERSIMELTDRIVDFLNPI